MNLFSRLQSGLGKTRAQIIAAISRDRAGFDDSFYELLEDALISADIGIDFSAELIERLKTRIVDDGIASAGDAYAELKRIIVRELTVHRTIDEFPPKPWVIIVAGVNGVGKTTTIGKLAHEYRGRNKSVLLGAADTFRAGAIEQLAVWARSSASEFVAQHEGADAASVAFDAVSAANSRGIDVLILDTAGRLHTKVNLMNELEKIVRVIRRHTPHAPNEILLVIDATTGQNAIKQAQTFHKALGVTGLIITKLDGTAKGGIALALTRQLKVPIKKIGVGESISDLQDFNAVEYVEAMFGDLVGGAPARK